MGDRIRQRVRCAALCSALALTSLACGGVDSCLDRGGSFNFQVGVCDLKHSQPGPNSPCLRDILGKWHVAGHKAPGISAASAEQADVWNGRHAVYGAHRAVFDNEACSNPQYVSRVVGASEFANEFRVPPEVLGLPGADTCITEIGCPDTWAAPGAQLIHSSSGLMTLWQGVFFELERDGGH